MRIVIYYTSNTSLWKQISDIQTLYMLYNYRNKMQ